jgi:dienelactone hydrolase
VLAHGWSGVREQRLDAFAERFAAAGIAALVFDYRYFGASEGEPRQLLDIDSQLDDWDSAVAYVCTRPDIDPGRVALWGTSLSGGLVLTTAARDRRVAAVVSQVPYVDGLTNLPRLGVVGLGRMAVA